MNVKEALTILNAHFFIHHCTLQTKAQNFLTTPLVFVIQNSLTVIQKCLRINLSVATESKKRVKLD